jgi:hypothetical protein
VGDAVGEVASGDLVVVVKARVVVVVVEVRVVMVEARVVVEVRVGVVEVRIGWYRSGGNNKIRAHRKVPVDALPCRQTCVAKERGAVLAGPRN